MYARSIVWCGVVVSYHVPCIICLYVVWCSSILLLSMASELVKTIHLTSARLVTHQKIENKEAEEEK